MRAKLVALLTMLIVGTCHAGEIREFDIPTRERLGRELARKESLTEQAQAILAKQRPESRATPMRGWVTELTADGGTVYFIMQKGSDYALAYTVKFSGAGAPAVTDHHGENLSPSIARQFKARNAAIAALSGKLRSPTNNFEVVKDPKGSGFLVYALAVSDDPRKIVVFGHYRVSVSADGARVDRVDALSRSIGLGDRDGPAGNTVVASVVTQLVSNVPVETVVFSSSVYRRPFFVVTMDRTMWIVADGKIKKDPKKVGAPQP